MQLAIASVLFASLVATGCVASNDRNGRPDNGNDDITDTDTDTDSDTDTDTDTDTDSDGDDDTTPLPPSLAASGAYNVTTELAITIEALLPQPGANLVATLRNFSQDPAHTLLDLAEDAGVPAVGELRSALPGPVEDKLEDWINGEISKAKINGVPVTSFAGQIVGLAETALTHVGVRSTLSIDNSTATHRLMALDLGPAGVSTQFELGTLPNEIVQATTTASITTDATGSTLALGDHLFALEYGEYAWQSIEASLITTYGGTFREILGDAMNCPAIAHTVANKCIWGQCVGHEAQLTEICEKGLDEVADRAHEEVASYRLDALRFAAGTATLTDSNSDGIADAMTGTWSAELNAGQGLRAAPATFTATR